MPWKACSVMDEGVRFIARLFEGESMSELCREAGIPRKTGYKILNRYKEEGLTAISDRSRRPCRYANQMPPQLEAMITGLKKNKPHWGARKLRERRLPNDIKPPAVSTIHAVLDRNGLVSHQGRPRRHAQGTPLSRRGGAQRSLVCRFQRRVQARQRPVLLPAHRHRPPTGFTHLTG